MSTQQNLEKAVAMKSKIFGDMPPYTQDTYKKLLDAMKRKTENIKRHIQANEEAYKSMIKEKASYEDILHFWQKNYNETPSSYSKENIEKYASDFLSYQLNSEDGLLALINKERYSLAYNYGKLNKCVARSKREYYTYYREEDMLYDSVFEEMDRRWREEDVDLHHYGFFPENVRDGFTYDDDFLKVPPIYGEVDRKQIDLLVQIDALYKQLKEYSEIIFSENPLQTYLEKRNTWASIMLSSSWLRLGRNRHKDTYHRTTNLCMIKPGATAFNEENMKCFFARKDRKFAKYLKKNSDMLMVTIPDSLPDYALLNVVNFALRSADFLKFICQSSETADKVDFVLNEMEKIVPSDKFREKLNRNFYWIFVDQDYYNSFMANTPSNHTLWKKYNLEFGKNSEKCYRRIPYTWD